ASPPPAEAAPVAPAAALVASLPEETAAPRCPYCSAAIATAATFCGACGKRIIADPAAHHDTPADVRGPGGGAALAWYFLTFAAVLVIFAAEVTDPDTLHGFDLYLLVVGLAGVAMYPRALLPLFRAPRLTLPGAAVTALATAAIFGAITALARAAPTFFVDMTAPYREAGRSLAYTLFDVGVVPAVTEEIIFRGVILAGLLQVFERRTAVVTSALLFATVHVSPLSMLHLALLGLILGEVRLRTRSLWPSMLLHAAYNAAVVLSEW
ncbi:MAG: CPBP family intramembrane metalloprotease, partial [Myxococcales bacterium]|nr:CPBP family intramembrane metalloprotease [Myxococcales bacterium]